MSVLLMQLTSFGEAVNADSCSPDILTQNSGSAVTYWLAKQQSNSPTRLQAFRSPLQNITFSHFLFLVCARSENNFALHCSCILMWFSYRSWALLWAHISYRQCIHPLSTDYLPLRAQLASLQQHPRQLHPLELPAPSTPPSYSLLLPSLVFIFPSSSPHHSPYQYSMASAVSSSWIASGC